MVEESFVDVCGKKPAISTSLVEGLCCPGEDWRPPKQFFLDVGQPFEMNSWEYSDDSNDGLLLAALQLQKIKLFKVKWERYLLKSVLEGRVIITMVVEEFCSLTLVLIASDCCD